MLTKVLSFANIGLSGEAITVEVGWTPGEGTISIVGLGDAAVQESKQRVRMALRSSGYVLPTGRTITVNLAPADVKKVGPRYDLPIALGLLVANGLVTIPPAALTSTAVLGELALDGGIRHVTGVLPAAMACRARGMARIIVPAADAPEAALVPSLDVVAASSLREVVEILAGVRAPTCVCAPTAAPATAEASVDFADVRGQEAAKRALEIAAAGGHNVLMSGAPGSGKTLLARALRGILPPLSQEESLEVTQIYSVANLLAQHNALVAHRPFRVVHHTASGVSIVGGGQIPGPGEISLAHRGVLFLDELAEFSPAVLEVLRQPLEDRTVTITRAQGSVTFPADFLLVAAMNPPQYSAGNPAKIHRRISAPLLDRIDLTIDVRPVPLDALQRPAATGEASASILARVVAARRRQADRLRGTGITTNKEMGVKHIDALCPLSADCERLLLQAAERLQLSARGYHRTVKVARTIADLAGSETIAAPHLAEALQYRTNVLAAA